MMNQSQQQVQAQVISSYLKDAHANLCVDMLYLKPPLVLKVVQKIQT